MVIKLRITNYEKLQLMFPELITPCTLVSMHAPYLSLIHTRTSVHRAWPWPHRLQDRLEGKVAIITGGAATGIGRLRHRKYASLWLTERSFHSATSKTNSVQNRLWNASFLHCDVTLKDAVVSKYGRVDVMYNSAGVAGLRNLRVLELDMDFHGLHQENKTN